MTKKDYNRIVEDLATAQNATMVHYQPYQTIAQQEAYQPVVNATFAEVARQFAYSEALLNPRFDRARFLKAVTGATGIGF